MKYMNYNTENPAVRDELWCGYRGSNDDYEEEKNCDLDITVNLERLTPTEADELLKALDNVKTGIGQRYLDIEDVDEAGLIVEVTGRVTVSSYDEAIEILKSYDVDYKEK